MKIKYLLPFAVCALLNMVIGLQTLKAQNPPKQGEPVLSGSTIKSEDIVSKCDAIFIGQIVELGDPVPAAAGVGSFPGVKVKVLQVLRGSIDGEVVKVTLRTMSGQNLHEAPPTVGSTYIFFVHKNTEKGWSLYTVLKLLHATDATTTKIKKLIPSPAGK